MQNSSKMLPKWSPRARLGRGLGTYLVALVIGRASRALDSSQIPEWVFLYLCSVVPRSKFKASSARPLDPPGTRQEPIRNLRGAYQEHTTYQGPTTYRALTPSRTPLASLPKIAIRYWEGQNLRTDVNLKRIAYMLP